MITRPTIRLKRLTQLVKEFGTIAAVADMSGTSEKYLSQLINQTPLPSGNLRQPGNRVCERLEEGAMKPPGWMDTIDDGTLPTLPPQLTAHEAELLRLYREANTGKRQAIMAVARLVTGQ